MEHSKHDSKHLRSMAVMATTHCLTGCAIGEVLGMVIGTALGWHNLGTIAISIVLAFAFGYSLTLYSLLKSMHFRQAILIALASDTFSIATMEIVDNSVVYFIPGAMDAGLSSLLFWGSLVLSLAIAFLAALPVNYYLISKGKGHAVIPGMHH